MQTIRTINEGPFVADENQCRPPQGLSSGSGSVPEQPHLLAG